jgi:ABC-2 type transport system ATP-binding protein
MVRTLVADGVTVLLTTQYLEEADELADQIAVIDSGRVIAEGSPEALKRKIGGEHLELTVSHPVEVATATAVLERLGGFAPQPDPVHARVTVVLEHGMDDLARITSGLRDGGVGVIAFELHRPSLDDVFFELTGARPIVGPPTSEGTHDHVDG